MTPTAAQLAILTGSAPGFVAILGELIAQSFTLRLSTLEVDWTDTNAVLWNGAAGVIGYGDSFAASGVSSGSMVVTWSGASSALMSAAMDPAILGSTFNRYIAPIGDDGIGVDAPILDFSGRCEKPTVDPNPDNPTITLPVENEVIILKQPNEYRYTRERQRSEFPGDTFCDFVAGLQNKDVFA